MARAKSTSLATTTDIPNLPAAGSTITSEAARQIAQQIAANMLRDARAQQKAKRDELARTVGGQIVKIDDTVTGQARTLMARVALIAQNKKTGSYSSSSPLDAIVKKIGAIVGELEAIALTDNALGLFERVEDHDYKGWDRGEHWRDVVGKKARGAAEQVLAQYTIVDPERPKSGSGKRAKNVTPASDTHETLDAHDVGDVADEAIEDALYDEDLDDE